MHRLHGRMAVAGCVGELLVRSIMGAAACRESLDPETNSGADGDGTEKWYSDIVSTMVNLWSAVDLGVDV
eukprot:7142753-Heterocapsa_arctica.AAC.1